MRRLGLGWTKALVGALFVLTFILGGVSGALLERLRIMRTAGPLLSDPPLLRARLMVWGIDRGIDLTSEEQGRLEALLTAQEAEYRTAWRQCEPGLNAARARLFASFRATLSADRLAAFDAFVDGYERSRVDAPP